MNKNPSFYRVTLSTKYFFSKEMQTEIAKTIAEAVIEAFSGLSCAVSFENQFQFQREIDKESPIIKDFSSHKDLRPVIYIQALRTTPWDKIVSFGSPIDMETLKEKLTRNHFLKDVVIFF
jgi:hypothetical protein